jgi:hypothetical protein
MHTLSCDIEYMAIHFNIQKMLSYLYILVATVVILILIQRIACYIAAEAILRQLDL